MRVTVLNQSFHYENDIQSVEQVLIDVNKLLDEQNMLIKYVVVDEEEIYDDIIEELQNRVHAAREISFVGQTREQAAHEVCLSVTDYLERALPQVELLFAQFYQGPTSESWEKLVQLVDGVQWLYDSSNLIIRIWPAEELISCVNAYSDSVSAAMPEIATALENQDAVSIADIVKYEFHPAFQTMQLELREYIDNKVVRADVN